jgi:hypothetical protein
MSPSTTAILPNLGAEEGSDWRAIQHRPEVRVAARLWSHLFSGSTRICRPAPSDDPIGTAWTEETCAALWPQALGSVPQAPVYPWLEPDEQALGWLTTETLREEAAERLDLPLHGPEPACVAAVHDKAFALEEARKEGLVPRGLAPLLTIFEPGELGDARAACARIDSLLAGWPDWTGRRYTLKPRWGSSGRGRMAGQGGADAARLAGGLERLARRGGAILEPWLERVEDLSVCVYVPPPSQASVWPTLLGSLEMLVTPSGSYRGHAGEVDARGRVYSGQRDDEEVRAQGAWLAGRARARGFFGPCGIDAFRYREGERALLRPAVELNARSTMGLVTLGLVRRALPRVRETIGLAAENRRAFLFALLERDAWPIHSSRIVEAAGEGALDLPLTLATQNEGPTPLLFFGRRLEALRRAHREVVGC